MEIIEDAMTRAIRILSLVRKEIRELIGDKVALAVIFIIPVVFIAVLGTTEPRADLYDATLWIIDYDDSPKSHEFIATFQQSSPNLHVYYSGGPEAPIQPYQGQGQAWAPVSEQLAQEMLPTEFLSAYLIIPQGFSQNLQKNGSTPIAVYYDMIDFVEYIFVDMYILLGSSNVQIENMIFEADIITYPETRPSDILGSINVLEIAAPLIISLILFFSMQLITTQCIVGDIPLKRLLNTSLRRGEVITGKILAYAIISVFQNIIALIMLQIFGIEILGLWIDVFIVLLLNSLAGICMGVFISAVVKTRLQGSQIFLLGLFYFLIVQIYARYDPLLLTSPLEQSTKALGALVLRGLSLWDVVPHILALFLIAFSFYALTIFYMRYLKKEFV